MLVFFIFLFEDVILEKSIVNWHIYNSKKCMIKILHQISIGLSLTLLNIFITFLFFSKDIIYLTIKLHLFRIRYLLFPFQIPALIRLHKPSRKIERWLIYYFFFGQPERCQVSMNLVTINNIKGLASQDVPFSPQNPNLRSSMPFSSSKIFSHSRLPSESFGILN